MARQLNGIKYTTNDIGLESISLNCNDGDGCVCGWIARVSGTHLSHANICVTAGAYAGGYGNDAITCANNAGICGTNFACSGVCLHDAPDGNDVGSWVICTISGSGANKILCAVDTHLSGRPTAVPPTNAH